MSEKLALPPKPAPAHLRVDAGMPVLIVGSTLAAIGEHFVRFVGFLEFLFGVLVIRIAVGVELHRQATVRLLQLSLAGTALHTQYFVIVSFRHFSRIPLEPAPVLLRDCDTVLAVSGASLRDPDRL